MAEEGFTAEEMYDATFDGTLEEFLEKCFGKPDSEKINPDNQEEKHDERLG